MAEGHFLKTRERETEQSFLVWSAQKVGPNKRGEQTEKERAGCFFRQQRRGVFKVV